MHLRSIRDRLARRIAPTVTAAVAAILVATAIAAPATAATGPAFEAWLYSPCVQVTGSPTAPVTLEQQTSGGSVIATASLAFDGTGYAYECFDEPFLPGMKVSGTSSGVTRTLTIPRLSVRADRTTDVIRGTSPAGKQVVVTVNHATQFMTYVEKSWTRTASSTGTWSIDTTSSFNLIGGDRLAVTYTSGVDKVTAFDMVPRIWVRIGSARVLGGVPVGVTGTVSLRSSSGTLRATSSLAGTPETIEGWASNLFRSASGAAVAARVGDRVSAPFQPSMSFTIPSLTVSIDTTTDTVSGVCPANRKLRIGVQDGFGTSYSEAVCTAGGTYSKAPGGDLASGMRVLVVARLGAGDLVERTRVAP